MQLKYHLPIAAIISGTLFCGCANNSNTAAADSSSADTITKKEGYQPAFAGQTKAPAVKTTTPYKVEKIAENLGRPWAVIPMPDGRLMITEKSGFITIHSAEGVQLKKITNLPKVENTSQGGLLDAALDPDFTKNRTIYWAFAEKAGEGNLTAIAKGRLSADESKLENIQVIFRATPALDSKLHFGSRLLFDKEGNLLFSTGERSILEGRKQAQFLNSGLGKIFRITKDGKPAAGNPFIGQKDVMPEIYSYGHRHPQSLDFHPVTGELWEAEFGPMGGDELNLIKPGKNYGWPIITYGMEYEGGKIGEGIQQKEGMEQPVYYWNPVISPSGMTFYTSDSIPEWKNNLFISCLSGTHIARLVIENNKVVGEESLLADTKERFRDVAQMNGKLYAVTDGGNLYRIGK